MCTLVLVNEPYNDLPSITNVVHYVTHKKSGDWVQFFGCLNGDIGKIVTEIIRVKQYFHKEDGRQIRQFIVSFEEQTEYNAYDVYILAIQIAAYYADRYQIVFGVHDDTDNLHIHFAFNSVSFVDGIKYSGGLGDMFRLKSYIGRLIKDYDIEFRTI